MKYSFGQVLEKRLGLEFSQFRTLMIALILILIGAYSAVYIIEHQTRSKIEDSLKSVLEGADRALLIWSKDHKLNALSLANTDQVKSYTKKLLQIKRDKEALIASEPMAELRKFFKNFLQSGQYRGFFIIDANNLNIASSRDSNVAITNLLIEQPDILKRLWAGEAVVSRIQHSDVPLNDEHPIQQKNAEETAFVGAPITNRDGEVIALLTLRFDPQKSLFNLLSQARVGKTGETYAFDYRGLMLTNSRFEQELIEYGLLTDSMTSALHVEIRDPGINLKENKYKPTPRKLPMTKMAKSATNGINGSDMDGYRDYRGVDVVGVWLWDEELAMGITTEQDKDEAYGIFNLVRLFIYVGAVVAATLMIGLTYVFGLGRRNVREAQARLKAIVDTAVDGIVVINQNGVIESANPAVEELFGYPSSVMINSNVSMLMPEPYHHEHDGYIKNYLNTGEAKIIGIGREVAAKKADGTIIPVELSITRLALDSGLHFAGIIRDIRQRKEFEQKLVEEKQFTRLVVDSLPGHITVLNHKGVIVFVNDTWKKFADENGFNLKNYGIGTNYVDVTRQSHGAFAEEALEVSEHLSNMLLGKTDSFSIEYPCHSPDRSRYFQMRASRFIQNGKQAIVITHLDITERVLAEEAIIKEKEATETANSVLSLTQTALERTQIAELWVRTRDLKVIKASDEACRHLGYTREELLTMTSPQFAPDAATKDAVQQMAQVKKQGWGRFETTHIKKDGTVLPVEVTISYRDSDNEDEQIYIVFIMDISERKQAEAEIITAREEAESANRAKSVFLATMSHEIRTPLNGIVGTIDMLSHTSLRQNQRDLVNTAMDSSLSLMTIIDDVLDFSKIEAGKFELQPSTFMLNEVIETMAENLQAVARKKGVEFIIFSDPHIPQINGDPVRLRQVLYNLAGNAIKFSSGIKDRKPRVYVSSVLEHIENDNAYICFEVKDNGIGMDQKVQKRLFQPFNQGEETISRRFGGTGLGLVISKRLLEMMGGSIELKSKKNVGSHFTVHIKFPIAGAELSTDNSLLDGLKVLMVQTDSEANHLLATYLQYAGAEVRLVREEDVNKGNIRIPHTQKEVIVVLDAKGDFRFSEQLQEQLRNQIIDAELRFVVVSRGRRRYARPLGDDGMTLDLNAMRRSSFLNAVAVAAGRESPIMLTSSDQTVFEKSVITEEEALKRGMIALVVDDNTTNQNVIRQQLRMLGYVVDVAGNGEEALVYWRDKRYPIVFTDCHMPVMDGYDLSRKIRKEEGCEVHTSIVAITADALKGTAEKCFAAGMDGYLTKPMQLKDLQNALDKWGVKGQVTASTTKNKSISNANTNAEGKSADVIDPDYMKNLLGIDDPKTLYQFYNDFLESSILTIEQINSANDNKQFAELAQLVHKIKSSAKTIGASKFTECCQQLEKAAKKENLNEVEHLTSQLNILYAEVDKWIENFQANLVCE